MRAGHPVAVLSYDYWRTRFGADTSVIGKTIVVNNYPLTIIGVSQAGFDGVDIGYAPSVRVPMMMKAQMTPQWDDLDNRRSRWANVFGRMKPGVTAAGTKAALQPVLPQHPLDGSAGSAVPHHLRAQPEAVSHRHDRSVARGARPITASATAQTAALVADGDGRRSASDCLCECGGPAHRARDVAAEGVCGTSRTRRGARRIVSQLLAESLLLAGLGGVLGLGLAHFGRAVSSSAFLPTGETPHVISGSLDWRILAFNFALALATGVLFGLVPALRSTRPSLAPTLKDQVGTVVGGGSSVRFRKTLVVGQVMLSVLLLIGAGLFIRSLRNLHLTDLGLRADSLIAFNIDSSIGGYSSARTQQFYQQILDRMKTHAGVSDVAFAAMAVLEGNQWDSTITIEHYEAKPGENMNPYCNAVSPGYFRTMGMPLVAGRDFDQRDAVVIPPPDPNASGASPDFSSRDCQ